LEQSIADAGKAISKQRVANSFFIISTKIFQSSGGSASLSIKHNTINTISGEFLPRF
jgi:hypothetical protein